MPAKKRYAVEWTGDDGTTRQQLFQGGGCYEAALAFRDRLSEDSAAVVAEWELRSIPTWVKVRLVDDEQIGRRRRSKRKDGGQP